jgi:hypothetical protein
MDVVAGPNDIEFSGERKRARCNEGLGADRLEHRPLKWPEEE